MLFQRTKLFQSALWLLSAFCFWLFSSASAIAGPLQISVVDGEGQAVEHAVVSAEPAAPINLKPSDLRGPFVMTQRNVTFEPYVLVVPKGATVQFPNLDRVNHHVYSFSPSNPFQLPLYGRGITRSVTFGQAGTAALGCNIHDRMRAYIRVVDTPYYAKTDRSGVAQIVGLPDGAATVRVWHPSMMAQGQEVSQSVATTRSGNRVVVTIRLRPARTGDM